MNRRTKLMIGMGAVVAIGIVAAAVLVPRYGPKVFAQWSTQQAAQSIDDTGDTITLIPRRPNGELVVYLHGAGQTYAAVLNDPETSSLTRALLDAGYTVTAAEAGGNAWGNDESVDAYRDLISSHDASRVHLVAESMGALAGAKIASDPEVSSWVALYPVCDVSSIKDQFLQSQIADALPGGVSEVFAWPDKPVKVWASPDDAMVSYALNADACSPSGSLITTTGDHGDASNFSPAEVVDFFATN